MTLKEVEKMVIKNIIHIEKNTTNISMLMKLTYFVLAGIIGQLIYSLIGG